MKMKKIITNANFCHIHNHTEFSSFDGLNKISEFPALARSMGFKALGITDHGNIAGTIKFFKECLKTHDSDGNPLSTDEISSFLSISTSKSISTESNPLTTLFILSFSVLSEYVLSGAKADIKAWLEINDEELE